MNQILLLKKKNNNKIFYLIFLYISILLTFITLFYLLFYIFNIYKKNIFAKNLIQSFNITSLYSNINTYNISNSEDNYSFNNPIIIGTLKIDKLNINYPIFSNVSDKLLSLSLCRFAGPMPNQPGNFCIAGHNYKNNTFFGKLYLLEIGDTIELSDFLGITKKYYIYDKTRVSSTDISCVSQNTNGEKIITLMTCNNKKDTRTIIKAKES